MNIVKSGQLALIVSVIATCLLGCKAKCPKGSALRDGECFWAQPDAIQNTGAVDAAGETQVTGAETAGAPGSRNGASVVSSTDVAASGAGNTAPPNNSSMGASNGGSQSTTPTGGAASTSQLMSVGAGAAAVESAGTSGSANAPCVATTEQCDNEDNDCDGKIDEDVTRECGSNVGECKPGILTCYAGKWDDETTQCQGAVGPELEECDATQRDENCDGSINEGCSCTEGETMPCGNSTPPCKQGKLECVEGRFSTTCEGEVKGSEETCDGRDNDCNGSIDENVKNECGGCTRLTNAPGTSCSAGSNSCKANGRYQCRGKESTACDAVALPASSEECDNTDNDCDGRIDEGLKNDCGGPCDVRLLHRPGESCNKPVPGKSEACAKQGKYECQGTSTVACTAAANAPTVGNCGCDWTCVCAPAGSSNNPDGTKCTPGQTKTIYSEGYPPGMCKEWLCMTRDTACTSGTPSC